MSKEIRTIQDIKQERQTRTNKLLTDCSVFWAFSNEQFEENKTPLAEGEKYVAIGAGGYMPNSNIDKLNNGLKEITKWFKETVKANKGARRANIAYELSNHEAYYTGDITDALFALGKGYTRKEVLKVYLEEKPSVDAIN